MDVYELIRKLSEDRIGIEGLGNPGCDGHPTPRGSDVLFGTVTACFAALDQFGSVFEGDFFVKKTFTSTRLR